MLDDFIAFLPIVNISESYFINFGTILYKDIIGKGNSVCLFLAKVYSQKFKNIHIMR